MLINKINIYTYLSLDLFGFSTIFFSFKFVLSIKESLTKMDLDNSHDFY